MEGPPNNSWLQRRINSSSGDSMNASFVDNDSARFATRGVNERSTFEPLADNNLTRFAARSVNKRSAIAAPISNNDSTRLAPGRNEQNHIVLTNAISSKFVSRNKDRNQSRSGNVQSRYPPGVNPIVPRFAQDTNEDSASNFASVSDSDKTLPGREDVTQNRLSVNGRSNPTSLLDADIEPLSMLDHWSQLPTNVQRTDFRAS